MGYCSPRNTPSQHTYKTLLDMPTSRNYVILNNSNNSVGILLGTIVPSLGRRALVTASGDTVLQLLQVSSFLLNILLHPCCFNKRRYCHKQRLVNCTYITSYRLQKIAAWILNCTIEQSVAFRTSVAK